MHYVKSFFYQFLIVFFANYLLPGVHVVGQTKLPSLGEDLPFALGLGLLNFLIFPLLKLFQDQVRISRIAIIAVIVNLVVYGLSKFVKVMGIHLLSIEGYLLAAGVVSVGSFILNYLELRKNQNHHPVQIDPSESTEDAPHSS